MLRADLVIVDDTGLLPLSADAAEGLYRLVDAAYERRSLAISSNLHPSGFDQLMERTIATALVDRLMHHAHVLVTDGDSIRRRRHSREGGDAPRLTFTLAGDRSWPSPGSEAAVRGEFSWPSLGRSHGRLWGDPRVP